MAEYDSLNAAMSAGDDLAEAEIRYRLLSESFESMPQLRGNLNPALEKVKAEISRLRALAPKAATTPSDSAGVVRFDPNRFRKSGS